MKIEELYEFDLYRLKLGKDLDWIRPITKVDNKIL